MNNIRNFSIIAHIDHGKSTLADRIIQLCGGLSDREMEAQVLDSMDLERERGITIKAHSVTLYHTAKDGNRYQLNFIDTPGHEAFTAMRARGAKVTDIAVLVVAADDGVMPQTIEALNHAQAANVPIVVAVNKVDKEGANPGKIRQQLTEYNLIAEEYGGDTLFVDVSAAKGTGIDNLIEAILLTADAAIDLRAIHDDDARGVAIEAHHIVTGKQIGRAHV